MNVPPTIDVELRIYSTYYLIVIHRPNGTVRTQMQFPCEDWTKTQMDEMVEKFKRGELA
jgi:hypothetical protein